MWKFIALNVSHLTPHVLRDPIQSQCDPIIGTWDLCGPSNCVNLYHLALIEGWHLF